MWHSLPGQVAQLEQRLAELDEEREELAKYRKVDKERRSLEYTIYDKDLHETRLNLDKVIKQSDHLGYHLVQSCVSIVLVRTLTLVSRLSHRRVSVHLRLLVVVVLPDLFCQTTRCLTYACVRIQSWTCGPFGTVTAEFVNSCNGA